VNPGAIAAAGLAALLALPLPAAAETTEEAVAYAFFGLADAAALTRGPVHLDWHETSSSPAVFSGHGEGGGKNYDVTFSITASGDCAFEVDLAGPPQMVRGGKTLYAKIALHDVAGITPGEFQVTINGSGYCVTRQVGPDCVPVTETDIFGALDVATHTRLVAQLRDAACLKPTP
jgi:hypothetical protein